MGFGSKWIILKEIDNIEAANIIEIEEDEIISWIDFKKEVIIVIVITKKFKIEWIDANKSIITKIER